MEPRSIKTIDRFEEAYRKELGRTFPPGPWHEITLADLAAFSEGVGDYNPLWRDPEYAANSRFGDLTAPPMFLQRIDFGSLAPTIGHIPRGAIDSRCIALLYLGAEFEWYRPMWRGDRVRAISAPIECVRKRTSQLGDALFNKGQVDYWNSRGEHVARMVNQVLRFENQERGVEANREYTGALEAEAPDPLVWARTRRGPTPRFWEDVEEDEQLPRLKRGTLTTSEIYLFAHGAAFGLARSRTVEEGQLDQGAAGRASGEYARKFRGQQDQFDFGPQRVCWLNQVVTDWMGDEGTLKTLSARISRPNLVFDTNVVDGKVLDKQLVDGEHLVTISAWVTNQAGVTTASASARVSLPSRAGSP